MSSRQGIRNQGNLRWSASNIAFRRVIPYTLDPIFDYEAFFYLCFPFAGDNVNYSKNMNIGIELILSRTVSFTTSDMKI
jgi:hypothetical protein